MDLRWAVPVSKFDEVARLRAAYQSLSLMPAWRDHLARLKRMRDAFVDEIIAGTLDKFGNSHDDEKRALIIALDTILSFAPALEEQFERLDKKKAELEDRAKHRGGIHGNENVFPSRDGWSDSQMY